MTEGAIAAAIKDGALDKLGELVPYTRWLGIRHEQRYGELISVLPFQDFIVGNPMLPAIHGGVTGAFLESASIAEVIKELGAERMPKIINITIDYMLPGRPKDTYARAYITRRGRRVASVRAEAWQDDRVKPIAMSQAHFLLI